MSKKKKRSIKLFYVDENIEASEAREALQLVWEEIQLIEYDMIYEGFRGVHLSENETCIHVTFQIASGGLENAGMATLDRETKNIEFTIPPSELLDKEIENLERMLGDAGVDISSKDLSARLREVEDLWF